MLDFYIEGLFLSFLLFCFVFFFFFFFYFFGVRN
jgi:hypothetical protein